MSTSWRVSVIDAPPSVTQATIQARLDNLENIFSNWQPNSAVSRWNASSSTDFQAVPREVAEVVHVAVQIARETNGALDVTVAPLIDLWGFGTQGAITSPPTDEAIDRAQEHTGWQNLEVQLDPPRLRKSDPLITINLSTLVEGYAADQLSAWLSAHGCKTHLVDVGGAIVARGKAWTVGVQTPESMQGDTVTAVPLQDEAVTTAGTYRKHFESGQRRYPHILDPHSGRPVQHGLVSVSVFHRHAMMADGYDTALLVLGPERGRDLAQRLGLRAMFIEEQTR
ncbi:MAG: FAD:protein FMN transferase [Verrucomicrobiaceae bacterium]